jgi:hypothetical protein
VGQATTGQLFASKQETEGGLRLLATATSTRDRIKEYLDLHVHAVQTLASTLSTLGPEYAGHIPLLSSYRRQYASFDIITTVDNAGKLIVTTEPLPANAPLRVRGVADRQYFLDAMRTGRTAISDVVIGRGASAHPTVVMATPYAEPGGNIEGLACGILSLPALQSMIDTYQSMTDASITVVDGRSQVVYANAATGRRVMQSLADDAVVREPAHRSGGIYRYDRSTGPKGQIGSQLLAVANVDGSGWKVLVEQPLLSIRLQTTRYYLLTLAFMALAWGGAVFGAGAFAKAVSQPLEKLVAVVRNVSSSSTAGPVPILGAAGSITEVAQLIKDVDLMQVRLAQSYLELEQALAQREDLNGDLRRLTADLDLKVRERTAEVVAVNEERKHGPLPQGSDRGVLHGPGVPSSRGSRALRTGKRSDGGQPNFHHPRSRARPAQGRARAFRHPPDCVNVAHYI